jgi:hypothetical protein
VIALILEFTLFFIVLFVVVPGVFFCLRVSSIHAHQHRHTGWREMGRDRLPRDFAHLVLGQLQFRFP